MRTIAAGLGVTATSIYRHFPSKDALVEAIAESGFARLGEYLASRRSVTGLMERFLDFALDEPRLYELMFLRRREGVRRFPDDFAAHRSATFDQLRGVVEGEMERGTLRKDDPLETTLTIWTHAHGLVSMFTLGRFGSDAAQFRALYRRSMRRLQRGLSNKGEAE